jgi:transposase
MPHRLDRYVDAERGNLYPCQECGKACSDHDFADRNWRQQNFFQHHCYLHARMPRTKCPEHGVKSIEVPWARHGSDFTLLFEQPAMSLVKVMPELAVPGSWRSSTRVCGAACTLRGSHAG